MKARDNRRTSKLMVITPLLTFGALYYFGHHAYYGELGMVERVRLDARQAVLERELAALKAERRRLEIRVGLLRNKNLDIDLLEEEVRRNLGYGRSGEIIVLEE